MRDHGEVGEVSLDARLQDGLRVGVAQGAPVLVQQVHQLLADEAGLEDELLPPVDLGGVAVGAAHELGDLARGELGLADVAEVPGEVDSLAFNK